MDLYNLHRVVRNQMMTTNDTDAPVIVVNEYGRVFSIKSLTYKPTVRRGAVETQSRFWLEIEEQ